MIVYLMFLFFIVFDGRDEYKRKRKCVKVLDTLCESHMRGLSVKYLPTAAALGHAQSTWDRSHPPKSKFINFGTRVRISLARQCESGTEATRALLHQILTAVPNWLCLILTFVHSFARESDAPVPYQYRALTQGIAKPLATPVAHKRPRAPFARHGLLRNYIQCSI